MNKRIRRLLLVVAALGFIIIAPVVVLYAVGYRFVPNSEEPRSVGVLLLETVPRNVSTLVDGVIKGTTPEAVSGLVEGKVRVRLEKEGYATWEKEIDILPTRATEFRSVRLFAQNAPIDIVAEHILRYSLAPNRLRIATLDAANTLRILNDQGVSLRDDILLPAPTETLLWSPDSSQLIIQSGKTYEIISVTGTAPSRHIISVSNIDSLVWDPRLPGRLLLLQKTGDLVSYSVSTRTVQPLISDVRLFALTSRNIIVVNDAAAISSHTLQGNFQQTQELPHEEFITDIIATPGGNIALRQQSGRVTVIDNNGQIFEAGGGELVGWSPSGLVLLMQPSDNELTVFNTEDDRTTYVPMQRVHSILRLSRPIHHPQWFAGSTHVVYQVDDEVVLTEVDTRDHPVQFTVDSTNTGNAEAMVGEEGFSMFYLKSANGSTALVSRDLVLEQDR